MRITHQMLHQNSLKQMNQTLSQLNKTFHEVSTGKRLHRPSDDPAGISRAMNLKSSLTANEQFHRNADSAYFWLDETDQTIQQMTNVLQRVRELTVQGSNDTLSAQDRSAIAIEIRELSEQIRQFANTKVNGNYLFNGQKTNTAPFQINSS
ncbi:MAG: flagellar hook-associated protein FlgL [Bacillus sp. (in: Bacteria)]|nr:flagellar hook-associated protein FlgL [Bacillus sp. (in: firmicutes)]